MTDLRRLQDRFDDEGAHLTIRRYRVFRVQRDLPPIDVRHDLRWGWLALSAVASFAILFAAVTP